MSLDVSKITTSIRLDKLKNRSSIPLSKMACDSVNFLKKVQSKLIDASCELLPGFKKSPLDPNDLSQIKPENLCLVHMTDWFPANGIIRSTQKATSEKDGFGSWLSTVHFSINRTVAKNPSGSWDDKKYGIILPFDGVLKKNDIKNIIGGRPGDFFAIDEIRLPEDSIIVRKNPQVPKGKLRIVEADNLVGFENAKGIKIVESSEDISSASLVQSIIKKTGKDTLDYDIALSANDNARWTEFCKKQGFENTMAAYTPWHRTDCIPTFVGMLKDYGNSWNVKPEDIAIDRLKYDFLSSAEAIFPFKPELLYNKLQSDSGFKDKTGKMLKTYSDFYKKEYGVSESIDFQKLLLDEIAKIKQEFPKSKNTLVDIDKLEEIIKNSETPLIASSRIKDKLGLVQREAMKLDGLNMAENYFSTTISQKYSLGKYGKTLMDATINIKP